MMGVIRSTKFHVGLLLVAGMGFLGHSYWIDAKATLAQVLLERAWVETLETGEPVKAWSWADTWPVAKLEFPGLGQSSIVLKSASGQAMAFGPGHVSATPMPGEAGTSIIAAHRDTHFKVLQDLKAGDDIEIMNADGSSGLFKVSHTEVVRWDNSGIDPAGGGRRIALVTCYPFGAITPGPLRYVVFADLVRAI